MIPQLYKIPNRQPSNCWVVWTVPTNSRNVLLLGNLIPQLCSVFTKVKKKRTSMEISLICIIWSFRTENISHIITFWFFNRGVKLGFSIYDFEHKKLDIGQRRNFLGMMHKQVNNFLQNFLGSWSNGGKLLYQCLWCKKCFTCLVSWGNDLSRGEIKESNLIFQTLVLKNKPTSIW